LCSVADKALVLKVNINNFFSRGAREARGASKAVKQQTVIKINKKSTNWPNILSGEAECNINYKLKKYKIFFINCGMLVKYLRSACSRIVKNQ
jgi:hypothetical protein